jgi:hypothetical protein
VTLLLLVVAATLAATGCSVTLTDKPGAAKGDGPHLPSPPPASEARDQLDELSVADPASMRGYSRDHFPHWSDQGDGCTTREVVLRRDGSGVKVGDDCYPTAGRWYSVYDQRWIDAPSDVDVDHMVPLANAWRSGANRWNDDKREAFANDLERGQLIAVSAASNRAKGDQDPSQWRPSNQDVWCKYARWWIDVKHHHRLTVTRSERSALTEMLDTC